MFFKVMEVVMVIYFWSEFEEVFVFVVVEVCSWIG